MNPAAIIIRLCYYLPGVDETARAWRFAFFRDHVLPRLFAQDSPVDVWVWVHERHAAEVEAMDPRVRTFTVDLDHPGSVLFDGTTLRGFPWRAVRGLPRYEHQVLMGSDDLIGPSFVSVARATLAHYPRALATVQPLMLDWPTGRLFEMPAWRRPSPFVVLRQPIADPRYTWVWSEDHRKLGRLVPKVVYLPAGQAVMTVHGRNDGTTLRSAKHQLDRSTLAWL